MDADDYPHLEQFLGAYFHQDWAAEGATWQQVVAQFAARTDANTVRAVLRDVARLLDVRLADRDLQTLLEGLGCCYQLTEADRAAAPWLRSVRLALGTALQARGLPPA